MSRPRVRIVLVEPHEAGNVGAAARALKNFGIEEMALVGRDRTREDRSASWWSSGAEDVLERALRFDTLKDALKDCHLAVATTAAKHRDLREEITPHELFEFASSQLGPEHTLAIVFGREEWGLRTSEIVQCQRIMSIPTSPAFPTMNLAQSVAVTCYELSRSLRPTPATKEPPPLQLLQQLDEHARHVMEEVHFFADKNHDRVVSELKVILDRSGLTLREASLMLALVRRIEGRIGMCDRKRDSGE